MNQQQMHGFPSLDDAEAWLANHRTLFPDAVAAPGSPTLALDPKTHPNEWIQDVADAWHHPTVLQQHLIAVGLDLRDACASLRKATSRSWSTSDYLNLVRDLTVAAELLRHRLAELATRH